MFLLAKSLQGVFSWFTVASKVFSQWFSFPGCFLHLIFFLRFIQPASRSQHNYLRITRILKSLGELGYESFKSPLVKFILHEALVENTIPNIKQSALEYFVYTIRDRRERRKLLRFAQKHYTPSENFIWGPPRKAQPEGSKAQKPPGPPSAGQQGQTSVHKKPKESKNASSAAHGVSKAAEDKKVASKEAAEEMDKPRGEPGSEAAQPGEAEQDGAADDSGPRAEQTVTHPEEQKENAPASEKDEAADSRSQDGGSPGDAGAPDAALP